MKRPGALTAATLALLLLLSGPTLASAALTNAGMLALRDGLMAQPDLALGTYPHYNALPNGHNSPFNIRHSTHSLPAAGDDLRGTGRKGKVMPTALELSREDWKHYRGSPAGLAVPVGLTKDEHAAREQLLGRVRQPALTFIASCSSARWPARLGSCPIPTWI